MTMQMMGFLCRSCRIRQGVTLETVATDLGMSKQNISLFERGKTNSARVLMWYVEHGLDETIKDWRENLVKL